MFSICFVDIFKDFIFPEGLCFEPLEEERRAWSRSSLFRCFLDFLEQLVLDMSAVSLAVEDDLFANLTRLMLV